MSPSGVEGMGLCPAMLASTSLESRIEIAGMMLSSAGLEEAEIASGA